MPLFQHCSLTLLCLPCPLWRVAGSGAETVLHTLDSLNVKVYAQYAPSLFLRDALFCVYGPNKQARVCMS